MNASVRVLGIGSPFGEDQIGWLAARALERAFDPDKVEVSWHDRPGAALVGLMEGAAGVVLIDGVKSGAAPGSLHRLERSQIGGAVREYTSTHGFGLAEALLLAEKLGTLPATVVLWGVELEPHGGTHGEVGARALPRLVEGVRREVAAICESCVP